MSRLRSPIKDALRNPTTPAAVARMWSRIEAGTRTRPTTRRGAWLLGAALVASLIVALSWSVASSPAGSLLLADGAALHAEEGEHVVRLSEGSRIALAQDAAFEPIETSATAVVIRHARGTIDYDIVPGGPRRWTIECGLASVQVVGTRFRIQREDDHVRVEVAHGIVVVRGDSLPDHVVRLGAGMHVDVVSASASAIPSAVAPASAWASASASASAPASSPPRALPSLPPVVATAMSVDELLARADHARSSGRPIDAIAPLERVVAEHAGDPRASLAAFTLGKIQLRSLHAPREAARAFERAIAMDLPGGIDEDAYVLLIESLATAGDASGARAAHGRYAARYPSGARAVEAQRWIGAP